MEQELKAPSPKIKLIIFSFSIFYPHIKMAQDSTDMMNNSFIDEMLKLQDQQIQYSFINELLKVQDQQIQSMKAQTLKERIGTNTINLTNYEKHDGKT